MEGVECRCRVDGEHGGKTGIAQGKRGTSKKVLGDGGRKKRGIGDRKYGDHGREDGDGRWDGMEQWNVHAGKAVTQNRDGD